MNIPDKNTINIVSYISPETMLSEFTSNQILVKMEEILKGLDKPEQIVIWSGD